MVITNPDYVAPDETTFDVEKPIRSEQGLMLAGNPIAIALGKSGAPRIVDAALDTTATTAGNTWVRNRTATSAVGAVGTYAMLRYVLSGALSPGATADGADLRYSSAGGTGGVVAASGTWRAMGFADGVAGGGAATTLFLRVS